MVTRAVAGAGGAKTALDDAFAKVSLFFQGPALLLLIITGVGMIPEQEDYEFSQAWISIAFVLWLVAAVVVFLRFRAFTKGVGNAAMLTGILHVVLVVALWDMIWKPGFP